LSLDHAFLLKEIDHLAAVDVAIYPHAVRKLPLAASRLPPGTAAITPQSMASNPRAVKFPP